MLKFFKKMERTRNFLLIVFAVVLVLSMIVFGAIMGNQAGADLTRSSEAAAYVGSEKITVGEIATQVQNIQQNSRQQAPQASLLVDGLIREKMIKLEADNLGLTASDAELAESIREMFKDPSGKPIDQNRYTQNAIRQAGSVAAFENSIRNQISAGKVQAFVTSGVTVSEEEVLNDYNRKNTKFNLTYVPISPADIAQNIEPSDEELQKYFEENKKDYYISLPQKKIRYVYLETAKVGEKLEISDEDLKAQYDKLPEERRQAGVNVQEIVLRVPKPEFDGEVLKKANEEIIKELRKDGDTVSEEKFAEVAKGQSENPATAPDGGRVKGLVRRATDPTKQDDPYQRILGMKEGQVTEPIKSGTNYYILRRGKAVPKSFEDMKKELDVSARNTKAYAANAALAGKVEEELKKSKDVKATAEKFATDANMSVDDMIRETDYVKPGDEIDKLGVSQDFEQGIATLENNEDVGNKIPVPGGFAIPLLVDKKDPRDAELDEVKDKVKEALKVKQAKDKIEEIANSVASNANAPGDLNSAASSNKLEAKEAKDFILGSPLGEGPSATTSEALEEKIYDLKKGEVTKEPIKIGDNYYIVGVNEREEASTEDFQKQRTQLVEQMLTQKKGRVFQDYLAALRQRLEKAKQITIYKDALAQVDSFAQANAPQVPQRPQMPQMPNGQQIPPELMEQLRRQQQQQPPQAPPAPPAPPSQ